MKYIYDPSKEELIETKDIKPIKEEKMDTNDNKDLRIANHLRNQWGINNINSGAKYKSTTEKKNFIAKQTKHSADKIVNKHYINQKNKPPFTQVAENAVKELSVKFKDGHLINNAGTERISTVKEAIEINEALDKNFQDHKTDDYKKLIESNRLARKEKPSATWTRLDNQEKQRQKDHLNKLEHFSIENSNVKHKDYPKKAPVPLNRYQVFNEKKKKALEEKEFNKKFEQEYGDRAIEKDLRAKEMANRRSGKRPYDNFTTSELIVAEHSKDRAKEVLRGLKNPVVKDKDVEDISRKISLLERSRKQTEAEQAKAKREYDAVMNQPKDDDADKGLGSILRIWKK